MICCSLVYEMNSNFHYNKNLKRLARNLRARPTKSEKRIWHELLSSKKFMGHKFLRQRPIDNYIVDFFCKELKLIIEIDGKSHEFEEVITNDIIRQLRLEALGYRFMRFSDWELLNDLPQVQVLLTNRINEILNGS